MMISCFTACSAAKVSSYQNTIMLQDPSWYQQWHSQHQHIHSGGVQSWPQGNILHAGECTQVKRIVSNSDIFCWHCPFQMCRECGDHQPWSVSEMVANLHTLSNCSDPGSGYQSVCPRVSSLQVILLLQRVKVSDQWVISWLRPLGPKELPLTVSQHVILTDFHDI